MTGVAGVAQFLEDFMKIWVGGFGQILNLGLSNHKP